MNALTWASSLSDDLTLTSQPDEVHRVPTDDGAAIGLGRYLPQGNRRFNEPVILCHGLGANRFNMDFNERFSLARLLARQGFDAWVLDLRGRGLAGPCEDCTFDDEAEHDVGAALRAVRATGASSVMWLGHSKGGMLAYAHLARHPDAPIRAAVGMGSPGTFGLQHGLKQFIRSVSPVLKLRSIPTGKLTRLALLGAPPGPMTRYMIHLENADADIVRRALANVPADISGGVARQFARWIGSGSFDSADGSFDYRAAMKQVRTPFLLIAGSKDLLAPPAAVRVAHAALGGPAEFIIASRAHGFAADYGHADLILGRRAPEEIFPHVLRFLTAHATSA